MVHLTIPGSTRLREQSGFTYLAILALIAVLSLSLGAASEHIANINKREREAELAFVGEQYRNAIASYYQSPVGGVKQFPDTLESLLLDKRSINPVRHLRRLYRDPITGSDQWGLVKTPTGQITGVYSLSNEPILATSKATDISNSLLSGKEGTNQPLTLYSDWKFVHKPNNMDESAVNQGALNLDENAGSKLDQGIDESGGMTQEEML